MAFNAPPPAAVGSDLLSSLGQRVFTLHQTSLQVAQLAASLGGPQDTAALRARLLGLEAASQKLVEEIEKGLLSARVQFMKAGVDHPNARSLKRLEDQYTEVKEHIFREVAASSARRKQFSRPRGEEGGGGLWAGGEAPAL